jgi:hypothetical protein
MAPTPKKSKQYVARERRSFEDWKTRITRLTKTDPTAKKAFDKWKKSEEQYRRSIIEMSDRNLLSHGIDPAIRLNQLPQPEDAREDLLECLYRDSVPNVRERTRAREQGKETLKQMEKLANAADKLVARLKEQGSTLCTQDDFFQIPLAGVFQSCLQLSASVRSVSPLVKRKYVYPLDIADCCMSLVLVMEDRCGLSQAECHSLVRFALLAHGCTTDEVSMFEKEFTESGTIGSKKESLRDKAIKSANILTANIRKN